MHDGCTLGVRRAWSRIAFKSRTSTGFKFEIPMNFMKRKPSSRSACSQTHITACCSDAVYEWEFQDNEEEWKPMHPRASLTIEVALRKAGESTTSVAAGKSEENSLVQGDHMFDLCNMSQTNINSGKERRIRRGQTLMDDWAVLYERKSILEHKLSQSEETVAGQETTNFQLRHCLQQEQALLASKRMELDHSRESGSKLQEDTTFYSQQILRLSTQLSVEIGQIVELQTELETKDTELDTLKNSLETVQNQLDLSKLKLLENTRLQNQQILDLRNQIADFMKGRDSGQAAPQKTMENLKLLQRQISQPFQRISVLYRRSELSDKKVLELELKVEELTHQSALAKQTELERNAGQTLIAELQTGLYKKQSELEASNSSLVSVRTQLSNIQKELDLSKIDLSNNAKHHRKQIQDLKDQLVAEIKLKSVIEKDSILIKGELKHGQTALKAAKEQVLLLQQQEKQHAHTLSVLQRRAELADKSVQEVEGKRYAIEKQAKEATKVSQSLIATLQTKLQGEQCNMAALEAVSEAQRDFSHFQLSVHQLLHTRPNQHEGTWLLSPCSAAPSDSWLRTFGKCVERAFVGTRASHRRNQESADLCEPPEYEVMGVDAVTNPDLSERLRQFIQQAESREPPGTHEHTAHKVVVSLPESMKLRRLRAGVEGFDEGMLLGWHGASDEVTRDIIADGFNPYCAGKGAGCLFGMGLYSAENSSKADQYAGPACKRFKKHTGSMCVILAAVYCGNMYEAKTSTAETRAWTKPPAPSAAQTRATGIKR
jgi:hypothetical protein